MASDKLHPHAERFRVGKTMYADDTTLISTTLRGALSSIQKHTLAAKVGGLEIHPGKLHWMKFRGGANLLEDSEKLVINGVEVKRVTSERYLGTLYTEVVQKDVVPINIRMRCGMSKHKRDVVMKDTIYSRYVSVQNKVNAYKVEILPQLCHSIELWGLSQRSITYVNRFQRTSLLAMVGRNYRDRIPDWKLYSGIRNKGIKIYPIEFVMAERKLKYFGTIVRSSPQDLARKVYWCDLKPSRNKKGFHYPHIVDVKAALTLLSISEQDANRVVLNEKQWCTLLKERVNQAVGVHLETLRLDHQREHQRKLELGVYERELLVEKERNGGWAYHRRPMP